MKRLQYDRYGGPEVMWFAEFEPARPPTRPRRRSGPGRRFSSTGAWAGWAGPPSSSPGRGEPRSPAAAAARELDVEPVVGFGFDPAVLAGRFDLVFDTPGMLPFAAARTLLKPGGDKLVSTVAGS